MLDNNPLKITIRNLSVDFSSRTEATLREKELAWVERNRGIKSNSSVSTQEDGGSDNIVD
ncbi:hypothetical protein [Nitrosococcus oceani]|uniref:hypothetical protein n=1 Tax=Nitrosococcus oceani TaxID=1229 RepID=UPI0012E0A6DF|nr:hypothetical protein [Nitrosococcus oceani]